MNPIPKQNYKPLDLIKIMRPWHWIKNCFVIAPLLFSGQITSLTQSIKSTVIFVAFCCVSSATYIINDICDREEDRHHPVKKLRPIASESVKISTALILSLLLIFSGLIISITMSWKVSFIIFIYIIITILYSLSLKKIVILDVMILSIGFVFRVLAGSLAISVIPSHWLIVCTIMISLFLGFVKRRAEIVGLNSYSISGGTSRTVLNDYSIEFLDQMIPIVASATIVCYALYTVDLRTSDVFGSRAMVITVPCVIYGITRYIYIVYHHKRGEDTTRILLKDIPTIINIIIWGMLAFIVITYGPIYLRV